MIRKFRATILLVALSILLSVSCDDANQVAGGNSRLILSAEPSEIGISGTSTLTVAGTDENGAPLPNGTRVSFAVDQSGRVDPGAVQLLNGSAQTTYFATLSSGEITITATSGSVQAKTTITVADDIRENVFVSANPGSLPTGGGTSVISAVVTDDSGRPISDIGVTFSTTDGTLQSNGDLIRTNSSGLATDVLNTSESATVTAETENEFTGQTTVIVGARVVCHMSISTTTPSVGQNVSFFDTSDDPNNQIASYHWEFGDGASAQGPNVQHAYTAAGTFEVEHSVIDNQSNTIVCDPVTVTVSSGN